MFNQPNADGYSIEMMIENKLLGLLSDLKKEKINLELSGIKYNFFDRCENLYVSSEKIYPDEDLPANFGVNRGYSGGGIHSSL